MRVESVPLVNYLHMCSRRGEQCSPAQRRITQSCHLFHTRKGVHCEHNHNLSAQTENQIVHLRHCTDRLLSGGTLHEFYLPQDMPHVCAGCYACMNGREDKCGGREYMQKLIAAIDDSELIIFCAPTYVYHIPGQVKTLLDHFAYRWLVHRPDLSLMCKQALIITTAAGGGMKSTVRDLRDSMNYWGVGRTHVITQAVWGYDWSSMPENFMHKIEQKVEKTVSAIRKNAGNVTPCAKVRSLFYMYRLFHKKRKMNPVDDEYWYQKGYVTGKPWKRGR